MWLGALCLLFAAPASVWAKEAIPAQRAPWQAARASQRQPPPTAAIRSGRVWWTARPVSPDDCSPQQAALPRATWITSSALALFSASTLAFGSRSFIGTTSDVGQFALPALATAAPLLQGDARGAGEFGLALGTALGITRLGKSISRTRRPNSTSGDSFPSGHTASAFAAATFLHRRYGPSVGFPAFLAALHTGLARVRGGRHYLDDVIAGAGVGIISAEVWSCILDRSTCHRCFRCVPPRWRVEFGFGATWQGSHDIQAPPGVGTEFDLASFRDGRSADATARVTVQYFLSRDSELLARIDPMEARGSKILPSDTRFGSITFPAGSDVQARWLSSEYKLRWRTRVSSPLRNLQIRVGVTLLAADYTITLQTDTRKESVDKVRVDLLGHVFGEMRHTDLLSTIVSLDVNPGIGLRAIEAEAGIRVRLPRGWDVGLRYRCTWREIEEPVDNDPLIQAVYLTIARSF